MAPSAYTVTGRLLTPGSCAWLLKSLYISKSVSVESAYHRLASRRSPSRYRRPTLLAGDRPPRDAVPAHPGAYPDPRERRMYALPRRVPPPIERTPGHHSWPTWIVRSGAATTVVLVLPGTDIRPSRYNIHSYGTGKAHSAGSLHAWLACFKRGGGRRQGAHCSSGMRRAHVAAGEPWNRVDEKKEAQDNGK